jgi:hypothetical protein
MKAIISSTYSDNYFYFLPITAWCWNKLGVDVVYFLPKNKQEINENKIELVIDAIKRNSNTTSLIYFDCSKNKEATYAQCLRLYGACLNFLDNEILIVGDVDMLNFQIPPFREEGFSILGHDLTPKSQYPMCYITGSSKTWKDAFGLHGKNYQQAIDELLGEIDCENMRGNYWSKDQEEAFNKINGLSNNLISRTNGLTPFAQNRIDRDDSFWRDRLNFDVKDAHLWRPGYSEENFNKILELVKFFYPLDNFDWLIDYTNKYRELL